MDVVDPGFCPRCGSPLELDDGGSDQQSRCPACGYVVFHNPYPVAVATVVDGDRALFVERGRPPEKGCWSMPGGYMAVGESPVEGAARELAEETGLEADPDDLEFVGTAYRPVAETRGVVELVYAVPREKTAGRPAPNDDAADLAFWSREEIAANPDNLRAGEIAPILRAIDRLGTADDFPLW